jgi:hypothetical protein
MHKALQSHNMKRTDQPEHQFEDGRIQQIKDKVVSFVVPGSIKGKYISNHMHDYKLHRNPAP